MAKRSSRLSVEVTGPFGVWENSRLIECHDTMEDAQAQVERYRLLHPDRLYCSGIVLQWFHRDKSRL